MINKIQSLIMAEKKRQEGTINLIASENYASTSIMAAAGSVLTNKYAEGYPERRYYGGCQIVDKIENHAINLAKKIFEADHANVQPHSGSTANFGIYFSILKPGDTILGMNLGAGGHLTHGHKINFSGTLFNAVSYGVTHDTEEIDYKEIESMASKYKPKLIVAGTSAYSRLIDYKRLKEIAKNSGAKLLIDMAHIAGLVASKVIPSPVMYSDFVSSTTHKTLRGPRGGMILCKSDYAQMIDKAIMPGIQGGPLMHIIAAKATAFEECTKPSFKKYQLQVIKNAKTMAKAFAQLGYRIVSGGTDTHLFLVDLRNHKLIGGKVSGRDAEVLLEQCCNIILNRNLVPFDTQPPTNPSGIRIGTPALTTRGFKEKDVEKIVELIDFALINRSDNKALRTVKKQVAMMCMKNPIY